MNKKFQKTLTLLSISEPRTVDLPKRNAHKEGISRPNSLQGRMVQALLAMEVGQMITIQYDGDLANLRSRITFFRKKYHQYRVTTRSVGNDKLNIWRVA